MADRPIRSAPGPEVVHVGSACRDIAPQDPRGWRLGGGVTYAALTTARLGLRTAAIVGVDREAHNATELDLIRDAGADLILVPLVEGPVYHNVETSTGRVQTCVRTGVPLPIPTLPASWLAAPAWELAPVAAEIGDAWAAAIPADAYLGVAWQGFLRNLTAGATVTRRPPTASPILSRADLVGVSHHDVDPTTPIATLTAFLKPGSRLVITRGPEGGIVLVTGGSGPDAALRYGLTPSDREVDPTGAGDTFLAALISTVVQRTLGGRRSANAHPELRFAAAAAALVVEGHGLAAVPDRHAVLARMVADRIKGAVAPTEVLRVGAEIGES